MNWDDFDAFCQVIEHGSFTAAARAMDRPKSSLSAAVARLETALDARLLERTTRRLRPTEAGESLHRQMGPLFARLREVAQDASAQRDSVAGMLRIAAPYEFGAHHLGAVACSLMGRYPALNIEIDVQHAQVDLLSHRYDIVFSMADQDFPSSTIVARRVFSLERGVFASPALVSRIGEPAQPQDLTMFPLLAAASDAEWSFAGAGGEPHPVAVTAPRLRSANAGIRLQAAIAGLGVARITATYCEPAVRAGQLRRLLPRFECAPLRVYALLPARQLRPAKVRAFLDALGEVAARRGLAGAAR
ncbi:MAG TPA: LysR family transcriptional regulator [Burkholderiaceae bacterium]|nr:LysR family transcriptional regulator [Burkholderiaceae bacterium]